MQSGWELVPLQRCSQPSKRLGLGTQGLSMHGLKFEVQRGMLRRLREKGLPSEAEAGAALVASKSRWRLLVWWSAKKLGRWDADSCRPEKQNLHTA